MRSNDYLVPCCGAITEWQVYIQKPGTIRFQVWRGLGTGEYELLGHNLATYNRGEEGNLFKINVDAEKQLTVKSGDFIGWYNEDVGMVSYQKEKNGLGALIMTAKKSPEKGTVVDWSSIKSSEPRSYAIRATVSKGTKPKFKNLNSGISVVNNIRVGTELYKFMFEGFYITDVPDSFTVTLETFSEYFSYNQTSNVVLITETPAPGKYSLDFKVKDHCGTEDTGTLKVEVKTKLPAILNLPMAVTVREDIRNKEVLLLELDVSYTSSVTCELKSVTPSGGKRFFLVRNVNGSVPEVYLKSSAHLNYDQDDSFELTIKCSSGKTYDTGSLFVNVKQNEAPLFTNLPSTVLIHADESIIGRAVFHIMSEDEENNPVSYNISCDPEPCPFNITKDGSVIVVDDVRHSVSNMFYIEVTMEDSFNVVGPEILVVNITGLNKPPFIYNLPEKATVMLEEHAPPMTSLFQVLAVDLDDNDTLTFSFSAKPTSMIPLFEINETTGVIYSLTSFNYEGMKSRNIKLFPAVSDGMSTYEGSLKVSIIDINEPPQFQYSNYTVYTGENKNGFGVAKGLVKATDLDKNDVIKFGLYCGEHTPMFSINEKTADIKQEYELDVDKLSVEEFTIFCNVSATDKYGMSSYASLRFIVSDDNDNMPLFQRTSYLFVMTRDLPLFTVIGHATAVDLDTAAANRRLFYYISENTDDFTIDENGTIYLTRDLTTVSMGTVFKYTINVEDSKRSKDTVPLTVVVLAGDYKALVSSLLVEELTFFSLPENMAWFVTAVHLSVFLFCLIIYLCSRVFVCTIEKRDFSENHKDVLSADSKSMETFVWNNLDKTGTRRTSMVSAVADNEHFCPQPQKRFRSMSLTPVREISGLQMPSASFKIGDEEIDCPTSGSGKATAGTESLQGSQKRVPSSSTGQTQSSKREFLRSTKSSADLPSVQSHLSLSEIETTTVETSPTLPWKPWAVSDFRNFCDDEENDTERKKKASYGSKMLSQCGVLNF